MSSEPTGETFEVFGVACGQCGGGVYMETCQQNGGPAGCEWAVGSECQSCGLRYEMRCADGHALSAESRRRPMSSEPRNQAPPESLQDSIVEALLRERLGPLWRNASPDTVRTAIREARALLPLIEAREAKLRAWTGLVQGQVAGLESALIESGAREARLREARDAEDAVLAAVRDWVESRPRSWITDTAPIFIAHHRLRAALADEGGQ